jgi:Tol biopolymer transport system component
MSLADRKPVQLTDNGAANFAPYFHPDGRHIIFCSNVGDPKGRNFDLYLLEIATKKVEQVTFNGTFDGFPMFTHDGQTLVFASNRNGSVPHETNVFIADWVW